MFFWDSHYFFSAPLAEVANPKVTSVSSTVQFQNLVSFHPWLGMGKTPGRTYGKALGSKLRSLDDLPRGARVAWTFVTLGRLLGMHLWHLDRHEGRTPYGEKRP